MQIRTKLWENLGSGSLTIKIYKGKSAAWNPVIPKSWVQKDTGFPSSNLVLIEQHSERKALSSLAVTYGGESGLRRDKLQSYALIQTSVWSFSTYR